MNLKSAALMAVVLVVLVGLTAAAVVFRQVMTLCDWIELLAATDQLLDETRRFLAEDTAALVANLPENVQGPATAVVTTARLFFEALAWVRDTLIGPYREALQVMDGICSRM